MGTSQATSLMSHIIKLLRIVMNRTHKKIRAGIKQVWLYKTLEQELLSCDQNSYQSKEYKCRKTYLCSIDYKQAFDKVWHEELLEILETLDLHEKGIWVIINLY